jgi:hypothetical protein
MDTPLINTRTLFLGSDDRHTCCSCCAGYCPRDDMDPAETDDWVELFLVEVAGVAYLTDRYVAVRADLCQPVPEGVPVGPLKAQKDAKANGFIVPKEMPDATRERITSWTWDRIDLAGLTVRGDRVGDVRALHLYHGETHAGWAMPAKDGAGIQFHELEKVRRIAVAADIDLHSAERAMRAALGLEG